MNVPAKTAVVLYKPFLHQRCNISLFAFERKQISTEVGTLRAGAEQGVVERARAVVRARGDERRAQGGHGLVPVHRPAGRSVRATRGALLGV